MNHKKNLVVLFGGQSSEHVVSCMSVLNVAANIDRELYNVYLVGITEEGRWLFVDSEKEIEDESWRKKEVSAFLSPDATEKCLFILRDGGMEKLPVDVVFPVLHGLYGEDGTVQGLLELAKIPYVGCGVLSSAVSMDKLSTKILVSSLGIRQAAYVPVMKEELSDMDGVVSRIEQAFPYPVFIKPSNAGSSRGVSRADNRKMLVDGLLEPDNLAGKPDHRLLGLVSIGQPGCIAEINNFFFRQLPHNFPDHGQSADSRIKDSDWCILIHGLPFIPFHGVGNQIINQLLLADSPGLPEHGIHADGRKTGHGVDLIKYHGSVLFHKEIHPGNAISVNHPEDFLSSFPNLLNSAVRKLRINNGS